MEIAHLTLSELDVDALKADLDARLDTYLGRSAKASDIDTLRLSKSLSCTDLSDAQAFKDLAQDFETASADLKFSYPSHGDVHIRVSTVSGSVWVMGMVPEDVIDYVFAAVGRVKKLP